MGLTRRQFLWAGAAVAGAAAASPRYRVGITTNTRGGWEKDVFLSFREAREVGYRYVESFFHYFVDYANRPGDLKKKIDEIDVRFVTISNSGPMEMHFEDPAKHAKLIDDHLRLARFIREFDCKHLKINLGPRRPEGTTDEDLKNIVEVLAALGPRMKKEEEVELAIHAHMWSQFENRKEIDFVLGRTDPDGIKFVLDTGHITLAGIDPVELTRTLGHRIAEFHVKDVKPENLGGAKTRLDRPDVMNDPPFFALGSGGVDFPAIKSHLDRIGWQGWLTVELDSSPQRPPKESAGISRRYLEEKLGLDVAQL
ncbi:MAG: sugar phosphate isomerase/epimerase [Bryobacteraceae bacterium]|nr:sugar phosphate isomerase/epimerase [Bryobacteraceae bacterium]